MPHPETGETERDFLNRCIPELVKNENYPQKQAVAICYSYYRREGTEKSSPKPSKNNSNYHNKSLSRKNKALLLLKIL
jgi:hypothetical protein